jgi:hypothetical protein
MCKMDKILPFRARLYLPIQVVRSEWLEFTVQLLVSRRRGLEDAAHRAEASSGM